MNELWYSNIFKYIALLLSLLQFLFLWLDTNSYYIYDDVIITSRIDCALKLSRGEADLGVFSEEELVLLSQQQPAAHRVIANIRHQSRQREFTYVTIIYSYRER